MMDVRNVRDVEPEVEHNGTVPVWWLIRPREIRTRPMAAIWSSPTSSRSQWAARSFRTAIRPTSSTSS